MKAHHWVQIAKLAAMAAVVVTALLVGYEDLGGLLTALLGGGGVITAGILRSVRDADRNVKRTGVLLVLLTVGCGPSAITVHARAADTTATVINKATDQAEHEYERRQVRAVEQACGTADPEQAAGPCRSEADAGVNRVRAAWEPVWVAHGTLESAHELWRETIQLAAAGDYGDPGRWTMLAARAVGAYRGFAKALRALGAEVVALPDAVVAAARLVGGEKR